MTISNSLEEHLDTLHGTPPDQKSPTPESTPGIKHTQTNREKQFAATFFSDPNGPYPSPKGKDTGSDESPATENKGDRPLGESFFINPFA